MAGLPRVAAIVQRIAADTGELARAHRAADLGAGGCPRWPASRTAAPGGRAEPGLRGVLPPQ